MKYYVAIDAGTSVIKTVIFNTNFKQINSYSVKNPVVTDKFGKSEIEMEKFGKKWKPYRGAAALFLWHFYNKIKSKSLKS